MISTYVIAIAAAFLLVFGVVIALIFSARRHSKRL